MGLGIRRSCSSVSSSRTLCTGGMYSAQGSRLFTPGILSFVGNIAVNEGGGMHVAGPEHFNVSGVTFFSNKAGSNGGAVSLAITDESTTEVFTRAFYDCQLEGNTALLGGALYISSGEGNVVIQQSSLRYNVAGENPSKGCIF